MRKWQRTSSVNSYESVIERFLKISQQQKKNRNFQQYLKPVDTECRKFQQLNSEPPRSFCSNYMYVRFSISPFPKIYEDRSLQRGNLISHPETALTSLAGNTLSLSGYHYFPHPPTDVTLLALGAKAVNTSWVDPVSFCLVC